MINDKQIVKREALDSLAMSGRLVDELITAMGL